MSENASLSHELTNDQATALLQVGLAGTSRPIDALMDRLSEERDHAWLQRTLSTMFSKTDLAALQSGDADVRTLDAMKQQAKELLSEADSQEPQLAALAGYFTAVAAGLAHHDTLLSSRPGEEWAEMLADMAGLVNNGWRALFAAAAERALRM